MKDCTNGGCQCTPNQSISCTVNNCAHHCQDSNYCGLTSIRHRDLPISQIAGLVGYNQVSNYIATFKRIIGCTPAQYRKQHLSKPDIPSS